MIASVMLLGVQPGPPQLRYSIDDGLRRVEVTTPGCREVVVEISDSGNLI